MPEFDYTCIFDPIGEKLKKGQMRLIDHATNQTYDDLLVAVDDLTFGQTVLPEQRKQLCEKEKTGTKRQKI